MLNQIYHVQLTRNFPDVTQKMPINCRKTQQKVCNNLCNTKTQNKLSPTSFKFYFYTIYLFYSLAKLRHMNKNIPKGYYVIQRSVSRCLKTPYAQSLVFALRSFAGIILINTKAVRYVIHTCS